MTRRPSLFCTCGLQRLLPPTVKLWHKFSLVACPQCGKGFTGRYLKWFIWKVS